MEIFFDTMNENILDTVSKETLNKQMKLIEFFIQLLPDSMVSHFSTDKNYLNEFNLRSISSSCDGSSKRFKLLGNDFC